MADPHHVVVVGSGFGGLAAVRGLARAPVRVTLVDRRNFHLFQPLLYQVATGGLSPANISAPIRMILRRQKNVTVHLAEVTGLDPAQKRVLLADGELTYDTLVVATGVRTHYFGHDDWERHAPGLKTIEDATEIRRRVLLAFERAERATDPETIRACLSFVIVGGGPTGVELAGTLAEIARDTLNREFRRIDPADSRIILVEGGNEILPSFGGLLSVKGRESLERLGVTVRTGTLVTSVEADRVVLTAGESSEEIPTRTIVWAAGVRGSALGAVLADTTDAPLDPMGRVVVEPDLTVPGHPSIFVIGDLAHFAHGVDGPLPGVAPVAMQAGQYTARRILDRLEGWGTPPFRYKNRGNMATIGRAAAVADLGWTKLSGGLAWLAWLFIHLVFLIGFENKVLVMCQWAYNYATYGRAARLITRGGSTVNGNGEP